MVTWMCDNVLKTYSTTHMHAFKLGLCLHSHDQDKPLCQQYVCMSIKSYGVGTNCVVLHIFFLLEKLLCISVCR